MNTNSPVQSTVSAPAIGSATSAPFQLLAGIDADKIPKGYRLIRIVFRADSNAAKEVGKKLSQGVIVPIISKEAICQMMNTDSLPETMLYWIVTHLAKIQDDIARKVYESGASKLEFASIDYTAMNAAIDGIVNAERAAAFRLSGDSIAQWYDVAIAPALSTMFATRLGIPADSIKVSGIVKAYRDNFRLLAGKSPLAEDKAINLVKALDMAIPAYAGDMMHERLLSRIDILTKLQDDSDLMLNI